MERRQRYGSSPRVRGTLADSHCGHVAGRFIPACAGNITHASACDHPIAVHPRVCGEHPGRHDLAGGVDGSSPRVRGTWHANRGDAGDPRFIPACAGNIADAHDPRRAVAVHPRVCGEHYDRRFKRWVWNGSSPRVRGTCFLYIYGNIQFSKINKSYQLFRNQFH